MNKLLSLLILFLLLGCATTVSQTTDLPDSADFKGLRICLPEKRQAFDLVSGTHNEIDVLDDKGDPYRLALVEGCGGPRLIYAREFETDELCIVQGSSIYFVPADVAQTASESGARTATRLRCVVKQVAAIDYLTVSSAE